MENKVEENVKFQNHFSLVPLDFLRLHLIPYSEMSIKNKSYDGYIERFFNLQKFFIPKSNNFENKIIDYWLSYNRKPLGLMNQNLFFRFITSLINRDFITIIQELDDIKIENVNSNDFKIIKFNQEKIEIETNRIFINDELIENLFENDPIKYLNSEKCYKYWLKANELLSDSSEHYFYKENNSTKLINILPAYNCTYIEFISREPLSNPLSDNFVCFLEKKFDFDCSNLEYLHSEEIFYNVKFEQNVNFFIIPNKIILSSSMLSKTYLELICIFKLLQYVKTFNIHEYYVWLNEKNNQLFFFIKYFLNSANEKNVNKYGKLLNKKNLNKINGLSKLLLNLKLKYLLSNKELSLTDKAIFLQILTNSIN